MANKVPGIEGRDHHPYGFSVWLAGGGIRGGQAYGATDDFGYRAITNRTQTPDLHATILHQLGLDHERLTFNRIIGHSQIVRVSQLMADLRHRPVP